MAYYGTTDGTNNVLRILQAEDLLAGLLANEDELGSLGQQLVYILLGAGITPSSPTQHLPINNGYARF